MGKNERESILSLGEWVEHEVPSLVAWQLYEVQHRWCLETRRRLPSSGAELASDGGTNLWQNPRMGAIKSGLELGTAPTVTVARYVFRLISMALSRRQKAIIILLLIYWPSLFVLAHMPIPGLVRRAGVSDKGLHFVAYLILLFLFWSAISPHKKVNWRKPGVWWIFLAVSGYGLIDELLQKYVGGRTCDATDFVANLAGMLTSLVLLSVFDFWTVCIVVTGGSIFILTNLTRVDPGELLPITSTVFYMSAYAFFTGLWIRYIQPWRKLDIRNSKFVILGRPLAIALAAPIGLIWASKLGSLVLGRHFAMRHIIASTIAVAVVVGIVFVTRLCKNRMSETKVRS